MMRGREVPSKARQEAKIIMVANRVQQFDFRIWKQMELALYQWLWCEVLRYLDKSTFKKDPKTLLFSIEAKRDITCHHDELTFYIGACCISAPTTETSERAYT